MWIFLSLLCAWFVATTDALAKRELAGGDILTLAWARMVFCAPLLLCLVPLGKPPDDPAAFLFWVAITMPLEIFALILYMTALKRSPLSLTVPFLAFTPVFLLGVGWLILGEKPGYEGVAGALLISAGGWLLSARDGTRGLLAPLRNFAGESGSVMMASVALIYSLTACAGKKLILLSSPFFMAGVYFAIEAALLTALLALLGRLRHARPILSRRGVRAMGFTQMGEIATHSFAVTMAPVAYMIAVKRTSLIFGVLYGLLLFREAHARYRLPGAALMLAGVFVLTFF